MPEVVKVQKVKSGKKINGPFSMKRVNAERLQSVHNGKGDVRYDIIEARQVPPVANPTVKVVQKKSAAGVADNAPEIQDLNAKDAIKAVAAISDKAILKALFRQEKKGKNRSTVMNILNKAIQ